MEVLPDGLALLAAGSQYCISLSAHQATPALSNRPVNNNTPRRLRGDIIDPRHLNIKQKPQQTFAMLTKTLSERCRRGVFILNCNPDCVTN